MSLGNIDKYSLQKHLGNGAFGDVYLAYDQALNTQKAIKILNVPNAHDIKNKLEEAQLLHKCRHKNIVHINEANIYDIDGVSHIVIDMEYLPLGSFEKAIHSNNATIQDSVRYVIDCLFALEHAHFNGVLHRDIKPANIMLCNYGAKLSDFGLATVAGIGFAGSPQGYTTHLAPEYFYNNATTVLTDIFAMGMTLYRACNYIQDWIKILETLPDPMQTIKSGNVVSILGYNDFISLKLKKIINKACATDPNQRFQNSTEFRRALENLKPKINWKPCGQYIFEGICNSTRCLYRIETYQNRQGYFVEFKKNNRKIIDSCNRFMSMDDAIKHMNSHIASTLYS